MFAHHRALHDALGVDDAAQSPRPCCVDEAGGNCTAIEGGVVALGEFAVVGDDHASGRIELAEAAQNPVLSRILVVAFDAHGAEQLLGYADLAIAVNAGKGLASTELAAVRLARENTLGIALADAVERFAGYDVQMPRLRVHGRGRAHGEGKNFLDQFARNRLVEVAACRAATAHDFGICLFGRPAHAISCVLQAC